jgi:nitroimidazol reductase NimA-like FMN-containing flavoprotein (pyridoxamine 5'-phosphate oxidase superfamily)
MTGAPDDPDAPSSIRTLSESECYELLAVATVGRIGFASSTGIEILPVDYRLGSGHRLFIKTSPHGTVGRLAGANAPVAFEVDHHASDFGIAWSVLMNGTLSLLDAAASAAYAELRLPPVPWPGLASTIPIQFLPKTISGRGLHRH